ncbi:MAG: hypothetical protein M0Q46_06450 [Endomicrobiales bacterium]|nr:hypothetical protein [Endomicrobiales bacterium]
MKIIKWIFCLPAGLTASTLAHILLLHFFGIEYEYEKVYQFWHSYDMGGMFISCTIMIFIDRFITFGLLVWVSSKVVPSKNILFAKYISIATGIIIFVFYIYLVFFSKVSINFSMLYKNTIDLIAMSLGLLFGYIASREMKD